MASSTRLLAHKHPPDQMHAALGENSFGWMAMYVSSDGNSPLTHSPTRTRTHFSGFGTSMTNSQMVIMWPNKDGSVTLSQRKASSHTQPQLDPAPQRTAQTYLGISAVSTILSSSPVPAAAAPAGRARTFFLAFGSSAGRRSPTTCRISFLPFHSKITHKPSSPLPYLQMANSSTRLSGPSPPADPPQKTTALLLPSMSTKAR